MKGCKKTVILVWFALCTSLCHAQVTFVIKSLPEATPEQDTIFISGTFNNWAENDPAYRLQKRVDGLLEVSVALDSGRYEYKFTRGNWMKVETNSANFYTANRELVVGENHDKEVYVHIVNWLDLGGARNVYYMVFYMFSMAFQGLLLIVMMSRIRKKNLPLYKAMLLFNGGLFLVFALGVLYHLSDLVVQSYLNILAGTALYLWAPLSVMVISALAQFKYRLSGHLFIPFYIIFALQVLRLGNVDVLNIFSSYTSAPISIGELALLGFGGALVAWCQFQCFKNCFGLHLRQLWNKRNTLPVQMGIVNFITVMILEINLVLLITGITSPFVLHFDAVFIGLSGIFMIEIVYLWKYPDFLQIKQVVVPIAEAEMSSLCSRLEQAMIMQKPFKDPDLNIAELSEILKTKPHILSRIINEVHHKNFRDFVNAYRVKEFIDLAQKKEYKNYTFLAIAHEVGFNSKSTFNLAFKKVTQQSPRAYLKTHS